jgi:hypothetical protein
MLFITAIFDPFGTTMNDTITDLSPYLLYSQY